MENNQFSADDWSKFMEMAKIMAPNTSTSVMTEVVNAPEPVPSGTNSAELMETAQQRQVDKQTCVHHKLHSVFLNTKIHKETHHFQTSQISNSKILMAV